MFNKCFKSIALMSAAAVIAMAGCESTQRAETTPKTTNNASDMYFPPRANTPAPKPAPVAAKPAPAKPAPAPAPKVGTCGGTLFYPTGSRETSALMVEKMIPCEIVSGQCVDYFIKVTNLTAMTLENVMVTDNISSNFNIKSSDPVGSPTGGVMGWNLGNMAAGTSKTIKINGCATGDTGNINACGAVSYSSSVCAEARIVKPSLKLVKSEPAEALICDVIPVKLVVTNNGTGAASNVVIKDMLPEGMSADGKTGTIEFPIGTLAPGASAERTYMAKAARTGSYTNTAKAMADGGLTADASAATVVRQPVLAITKDCPGTVVAAGGRTITNNITVTNTGDAPAAATMLEDPVPAGTTFASATDGGALQGSVVMWNLGTLAPKASKKVSMTVTPGSLGTVNNTATAKATCAAPVSASCKTEVRGVPGVLLEVVDNPDPIVVGATSTYTIRVTNQGQIDITNIKVKLECEDTAGVVSNAGATAGTTAGRVVTFAPVARLASKGVVEWTVVLKAVKSDDHRLAVEMICDQIQRPVNETESTTFFE